MKALIAASFLSLLFATACNSGADTTSSEPEKQSPAQTNEPAITGTHWKLVMLEGQPEKMAENQEQDRYFTLDAAEKTVSGFAGCNSILGAYALEDGMRIRFSNMGITMRACPDVDVDEAALMTVFEQADNYTIIDGKLSLNVGRRAPLAVFEAAKSH